MANIPRPSQRHPLLTARKRLTFLVVRSWLNLRCDLFRYFVRHHLFRPWVASLWLRVSLRLWYRQRHGLLRISTLLSQRLPVIVSRARFLLIAVWCWGSTCRHTRFLVLGIGDWDSGRCGAASLTVLEEPEESGS